MPRIDIDIEGASGVSVNHEAGVWVVVARKEIANGDSGVRRFPVMFLSISEL